MSVLAEFRFRFADHCRHVTSDCIIPQNTVEECLSLSVQYHFEVLEVLRSTKIPAPIYDEECERIYWGISFPLIYAGHGVKE
jgi:hypothetical protein